MEVRIATASDLFEGRAIASHLRAEGIPCRIQSESLGPFVLSVGSMATADVFVPEEFEESARAILEPVDTPDRTEDIRRQTPETD